jgi:peroxiredoxin
MKIKNKALLIGSLMLYASIAMAQIKTNIRGVVKDSTIKSILLLKAGEDLRHGVLEIPVKNMSFNHIIELDYPEYYTLFLGKALQNAGGRFMNFFIEGGNLEMTIYTEDSFDKNVVNGGSLNQEFKRVQQTIKDKFYESNKPLQDSIGVLFKSDTYFSDAMKTVIKKLRNAKTQDEKLDIYKEREQLEKANLHLSDVAKPLVEKRNKIFKELNSWIENYISNNNSLVGYHFLLENLLRDYKKEKSYNQYLDYLKKYSTLFPGHPYNEKTKNLLESYKINTGGKFVDFTNPDLEGKNYTLSNLIKDKVAVIDLWATWCGPCIAKSRRLVPVYNKYKNKGFTIVGVAGEFKDTNRLKTFLEKEKYPWFNLVELDNQNNIWDKYGVSNSGGGIFLVDKDGTILAVNPTAKEVEEKLKEVLN